MDHRNQHQPAPAGFRGISPYDLPDIGAGQARLAASSQRHGLSVADHLVVATALHHHLTILHEDADFGTAAAVVPDIQQQRILTGGTGMQGAADE